MTLVTRFAFGSSLPERSRRWFWGSPLPLEVLTFSINHRWMSALGQKQTCAAQKAMSALPPNADVFQYAPAWRVLAPKPTFSRGWLTSIVNRRLAIKAD